MAVTHSHPVKTIPAHDENDRAIYSRVFDLNDFAWLEKEYPLLPCILSEFDREAGICHVACSYEEFASKCSCRDPKHKDTRPAAHKDSIMIHIDGICRNSGTFDSDAAYSLWFGPKSKLNFSRRIPQKRASTKHKAELVAAIEALRYVQTKLQPRGARSKFKHIVLVCHSPYLVDVATAGVVMWRQTDFTYCNCAQLQILAAATCISAAQNAGLEPKTTSKSKTPQKKKKTKGTSGTQTPTHASLIKQIDQATQIPPTIKCDSGQCRSPVPNRGNSSSSPAKLSPSSAPTSPVLPPLPPNIPLEAWQKISASITKENLAEAMSRLPAPSRRSVKHAKLLRELDDLITSLEDAGICVAFWEIEKDFNEDATELAKLALLDPCSEIMWQFGDLVRDHRLEKRRLKKQDDDCKTLKSVLKKKK